jgi:hypothetical protein
MKKITLVYAYYDNPGMFQIHQRLWNSYSARALEEIEMIVCDDCSPNHPLGEYLLPASERKYDLKVWRVTENIPWNWIACRNKGAFEAAGKWIMHTDIDLAWHPETADKVLDLLPTFEDGVWYTMDRIKMPEGKPYKGHPNSYIMTKDLYWRIGGYDEEYCGFYGSDGSYRRRCVMFGDDFQHLHGIPLHYYPRGVYKDSGCATEDRVRYKDRGKDREVLVRSQHNVAKLSKPLTMTYEYERVL